MTTLIFCVKKKCVEDLGDYCRITIQDGEPFLHYVLKARANPGKVFPEEEAVE